MSANLGARAIILSVGQTATRVVNLLWVIYFSRWVGPADFGVYTTVMSYVACVLPLSNFGVSLIVIRDSVREPHRARELFGSLFWIRLLASLLCWTLILLCWPLFGYPDTWRPLFWLAGAHVLISTVHQVAEAVYIARERPNYLWTTQMAGALLWAALAVTAIRTGTGLLGVFTAMVMATLSLSLVHAVLVVSRFERPALRVPRITIWKTLVLGAPIGFITLLSASTERLDRVFLSWHWPASTVGEYGLAILIAYTAVEVLWYPFTTVLYPLMARHSTADSHGIPWITEKMFLWSLILACPLAVGLTLGAPGLIWRVWGDRYMESGHYLMALAWMIPFLGWNKLVANTLLARQHDRDYLRINTWMMGCSAGFNLLLIPVAGAWAAAGVAIFSQILGTVFFSRRMSAIAQHPLPWGRATQVLLLAILCFAPTVLFPQRWIGLSLSGFAFFYTIHRIVFDEDDRAMLKRWMTGLKSHVRI